MASLYKEKVLEVFNPGGILANSIPGYSYRSEQVKLAAAIAHTFEAKEFLVAEAGTGVGKTLAYLVPAVLWAITEKERVVISTKTKALQQQIAEKDIPIIIQSLGKDFKYAEAKGRDNYLCWHKYINILSGRRKLDLIEQEFIQAILPWAEQTATGDRNELNIDGRLLRSWGIVAADRYTCWKEMCPYTEKCFRLKMLKRLESADIIITNHALMLSDLMLPFKILPEYRYLIIDEAHTFDKESFDKISCRFHRDVFVEYLGQLYTRKPYEKGYLLMLSGKYPDLSGRLNETLELVEKAIDLTYRLFSSMLPIAGRGEEIESSAILKEEDIDQNWFAQVAERHQDLQHVIALLVGKILEIGRFFSGSEEERELIQIANNLMEYTDHLYQIIEEDLYKEDKIAWVNFSNREVVEISTSSVRMGEVLSAALYDNLNSLVMVSATLSVEGKLDFFMKKTGLDSLSIEGRVNSFIENSPFAYEHQSCLILVKDLPEPNAPDFNREAARVLSGIISSLGGRILVLFTARKSMNEVARLIKKHLPGEDYELLVQYESGESRQLLDKFMASNNTVLMGLDTFWEGIDLKGDALKCVVITRLPFRSPADPFSQAWERYWRLQNKNSFQSFLLPDAVVRLRQGIGRLIRSESDRGVIVLLDKRFQNKSYGKAFSNSIPITNIARLDSTELDEWIKNSPFIK
jgi:ATP-dependent DNA helicase DinG